MKERSTQGTNPPLYPPSRSPQLFPFQRPLFPALYLLQNEARNRLSSQRSSKIVREFVSWNRLPQTIEHGELELNLSSRSSRLSERRSEFFICKDILVATHVYLLLPSQIPQPPILHRSNDRDAAVDLGEGRTGVSSVLLRRGWNGEDERARLTV